MLAQQVPSGAGSSFLASQFNRNRHPRAAVIGLPAPLSAHCVTVSVRTPAVKPQGRSRPRPALPTVSVAAVQEEWLQRGMKSSPCRPRGKTALAAVNGPSLGHAATPQAAVFWRTAFEPARARGIIRIRFAKPIVPLGLPATFNAGWW